MATALRRPVARRVARLQDRHRTAGLAGRRWHAHQGRAGRGHRLARPVRRLRARDRLDRSATPATAASSTAAPRKRATSTGRRRSISCSTTSAARTTRPGSPVPGPLMRSTRRRPGTSSQLASGTAPASSPAGRTWSIGSTASSCSSTSCGAPTGKPRSRPASSGSGRASAVPPPGTWRCRAITPGGSRFATSASAAARVERGRAALTQAARRS